MNIIFDWLLFQVFIFKLFIPLNLKFFSLCNRFLWKRIILFSRIKKRASFLLLFEFDILFIGEGGGLHRFREESFIKRRKARRLPRIRRSLYHLRAGGDGFWGWMRFEACGKKAFSAMADDEWLTFMEVDELMWKREWVTGCFWVILGEGRGEDVRKGFCEFWRDSCIFFFFFWNWICRVCKLEIYYWY